MARKSSKYTLKDGTPIPRCTQVIDVLGFNKHALQAWTRKEAMAGRDPFKQRDKAASTGTLCHKMIEGHIKQEKVDLNKYDFDSIVKANKGFEMYCEWENVNVEDFLESEYKIISEAYKWGGTADGIIKRKDKIYLIDFKTSKGIYSDHIIQIAAYKNGIEEMGKYKIDGVEIIHINKNATATETDIIKTHTVPNELLELGWEAFECALKLYNLKDKLRI